MMLTIFNLRLTLKMFLFGCLTREQKEKDVI